MQDKEHVASVVAVLRDDDLASLMVDHFWEMSAQRPTQREPRNADLGYSR